MSRLSLFTVLVSMAIACNRSPLPGQLSKHRIILVPFETTQMGQVKLLQKKLEDRLNVIVTIDKPHHLPANAFYPARQRYIADSLLEYLKAVKPDTVDKIIGLAASDISTRMESHANWGVMGLALCPGPSCVISSYRVRVTVRNQEHFIQRMMVLAMHELGHTYSLPHCKNENCIMQDAEGKMKLDRSENYCDPCKFALRKQGLVK